MIQYILSCSLLLCERCECNKQFFQGISVIIQVPISRQVHRYSLAARDRKLLEATTTPHHC